tara:strand:- start:183 stop:419 length:237 start_codon:yes stop_codon:yes gene_type:complete
MRITLKNERLETANFIRHHRSRSVRFPVVTRTRVPNLGIWTTDGEFIPALAIAGTTYADVFILDESLEERFFHGNEIV